MLSLIMLSAIMLSVIMLSVIMLSVIMLIVIKLNVIMLSVIKLNVIMLSVMAPLSLTASLKLRQGEQKLMVDNLKVVLAWFQL